MTWHWQTDMKLHDLHITVRQINISTDVEPDTVCSTVYLVYSTHSRSVPLAALTLPITICVDNRTTNAVTRGRTGHIVVSFTYLQFQIQVCFCRHVVGTGFSQFHVQSIKEYFLVLP